VACFAWGPAAAISHCSAAALRKLPGFEPGRPELSVPRDRKRKADGIIHRPLSLPPVDVEVLDAIPVTTVARTFIDIAGIVSPENLEVALDDALRRGLVSVPRLRWRLKETDRGGRAGIAALRALLDVRDGSSHVTQSVFETKVLQEIRRAALPEPVLQYEIRDGGLLIAIVDFAYSEEKVAIEVEGRPWHTGRIKFESDLGRRNALTELGWRVIHVTWGQFVAHPERMIRGIVRALELARRG
jgi:very-short-patch-repair endonuclease